MGLNHYANYNLECQIRCIPLHTQEHSFWLAAVIHLPPKASTLALLLASAVMSVKLEESKQTGLAQLQAELPFTTTKATTHAFHISSNSNNSPSHTQHRHTSVRNTQPDATSPSMQNRVQAIGAFLPRGVSVQTFQHVRLSTGVGFSPHGETVWLRMDACLVQRIRFVADAFALLSCWLLDSCRIWDFTWDKAK